MLKGFDISSHQPREDWPTIAQAGYSFVIMKLTGGTSYRNEYFDAQRAGAKAAELITGFYHYAGEPTDDPGTAAQEAAYFLANLPTLEVGDILALDLEEARPGVDLAAWALAWCQAVEAATGVIPVIYTGNYFIVEQHLQDPRLARYPLWLASWQANVPPIPQPWAGLAVWQHTDDTAIPGIPALVDEDLVLGNLGALLALGKQPDAVVKPLAFPHAPGFLDPLVDSFDWQGAGVVTYRKLRAYNDEKRLTYEREWDAATGYSPWRIIV